MPAPDPHRLWIENYDSGGFGITYERWVHGNPTNRARRAKRIAKNIFRDGWHCAHCGEPIPLYRRTDARFCREWCRKRAARARRLWLACTPAPGV